MADLTITVASVKAQDGAKIEHGTAGATILAGQVVYLDAATNTYKLSDSNSATAAVRDEDGISLHASLANQPLAVCTSGPLNVGATLALGTTYYASETPGGIEPEADVGTGEFATILGQASSTSILQVGIRKSGVARP